MLRYKTQTRPGLVAVYDIRPGNGAGLFLQPQSPHRAIYVRKKCVKQRRQSLFGFALANQLTFMEITSGYVGYQKGESLETAGA